MNISKQKNTNDMRESGVRLNLRTILDRARSEQRVRQEDAWKRNGRRQEVAINAAAAANLANQTI